MAITIAAGLISATGIILIVLPCLLMILDDIKGAVRLLWTGERRIDAAPAADPAAPGTAAR
jgi:hypothetical protein